MNNPLPGVLAIALALNICKQFDWFAWIFAPLLLAIPLLIGFGVWFAARILIKGAEHFHD